MPKWSFVSEEEDDDERELEELSVPFLSERCEPLCSVVSERTSVEYFCAGTRHS